MQKAFKLKLLFPAWQCTAWLALAWLLGGSAGFIALLCFFLLALLGAKDDPEQHGISAQTASRMGGAIIAVFLLFSLIALAPTEPKLLPNIYPLGLIVVLSFYLLGVLEDFIGGIAPLWRLLLMLFVAGSFVIVALGLVTNNDEFIQHHSWVVDCGGLSLLVGTLWVAGLPNAFNIADGANGLVAGLSCFILLALIEVGKELGLGVAVWEILLIGTLLFLLPNVITGKLFLGDGGAYLLGSCLAISILSIVSVAPDQSLYFLALMFYPLADLGWAVMRRLFYRRSPFNADERHLHNYIYSRLRRRTEPLLANSVTGLSIVALFTGVPFLLGQWLIISPWNWLWVLALQLLSYLLLWQWLNKKDAK
ncbi:MAG: hypothetical protein ACN4EJ_06595 [Porticoccaceae bacterium]